MKSIIILIMFMGCLSSVTGNAQVQEFDEATYKAYLGSKDVTETKAAWKKVVANNQTAYQREQNPDQFFKLALSQYGLLEATMRDRDEDLFESYVADTEKNLEKLINDNHRNGESRALLAAVYGLTIGYSPWKGMYLGPKNQSLLEKAKNESPDSPLVWKLFANSKYFTPEMWGGDLKEAISSYEKAIQLYEKDPHRLKYNWLYLDTMAFLGQAYLKDGQQSKAVEIFEKALRIEPAFGWVKSELLPEAKSVVSK